MLGNDLCSILIKQGFNIYPTDINIKDATNRIHFLDIEDLNQIKTIISKVNPDLLFHLAAETDVDKCELDPDHAYRVNVLGTQNLASVSKEHNIQMSYVGTCGIFDGKKQVAYNENDVTNPVSVYAKTKLEGERIVKALINKHFIFRVGWMMGGEKNDKKFVAKIVKLILTKKEIFVVDDKFGSPTYTVDLARAMTKIIKGGFYGLYHLTNTGSCSRYELACKIRDILNKKEVVIKPISSHDFPLPAPRPDSEVSESMNLKLIGFDGIMRPWQDALEDYLKELVGKG